jgi:hypothetical protein
LSEHPPFLAPFQIHQIQPFTLCSCTKRVSFRYRFDAKPPVIVRWQRAGFRSACGMTETGADSGWQLEHVARITRQGGRKPIIPISPGISSPRNPARFGRQGQGRGKCLPDAHQRKEGPPRNAIAGGILARHFNPGMVWCLNRPPTSDVTGPSRHARWRAGGWLNAPVRWRSVVDLASADRYSTERG